jgi:uncharacterized membrane protein YdjX (TVP38/TMEM64 family)
VPHSAHALSHALTLRAHTQTHTKVVQDSVAGAGALGPLYFGAGYVAATVALLPASVLTLGAPCARMHTRIHAPVAR